MKIKIPTTTSGGVSKQIKKENIIIFSAHSDDFVLGAGGTIAKYRQEGKRVLVAVFSYGEMSHPWLKKSVVKTIRAKEAQEASNLLKCRLTFFNLREGRFLEDYPAQEKHFLRLLQRYRPAKIFTHSSEDPHPDHRAVHKITLGLYDKAAFLPKLEVYTYSVWNPVSFRTEYPALYIDVSRTFSLKLKALKQYQSQKVHIAYPFLLLLYRAVKDGFKIRKRFGEHFFRVR